eukprot:TRINITY_DN1041_c0_g1_i1.p1 TRINITY_DN1041_c0_g1~~TRINITY_DN1041_c0_g1_i1.p1  ORF type:complete len:357 (-),score=109.62 TRINITY_DN1041_c0_g1_i1:227-1213(-)
MAWFGRSAPYDASAGKGGGGGGARSQQHENNPPSDNLYVMGLPAGINEDFIRELFKDYGTVTSVRVMPQRGGAEASLHALVRFSTIEEATTVKNTVSGGTVEGSTEPLKINFAPVKRNEGGGGCKGGDGGKGGDAGCWGKGGGKDPWSMLSSLMGMMDGGMGDMGDMGDMGMGMGDMGMDGGKGGCFAMGKGGGKDGGKDGGKKGKGKGKGDRCPMDTVMEAFAAAQVLPGANMGQENNLYVAGLPADCTEHHLYKLFSCFGPIPSNGVKAMRNPDGSCKGIGFVNFIDNNSMQQAAQLLNGAQLPDGSTLTVKPKTQNQNQASYGGW